MLIALPLAIILIGAALFIAMLIGVLMIAAAGGSRGAYGRHPIDRPPTHADMGVWGGDTPTNDDRGVHHAGHHSLSHHHQHHEPFIPGHTTSAHGDVGSHSSAGHGGFDGGSHGGFSGGGHSGHF